MLSSPFVLGGVDLEGVSMYDDYFDLLFSNSYDSTWKITPVSVPSYNSEDGQSVSDTEINFKVYLPDETLPFIDDTRTIEFRSDDGNTISILPDYYTVPLSDATGPRYRKIALNGRPMPDEPPPAAPETDEAREETYVDAFNLNLQHSVTDIYVPVPGSDLVLSVRRNLKPEIWSDNTGLNPTEDPALPFGACWSSNITPHVRIVEPEGPNHEGYEEPNRAYVTDENGQVFEFVEYEDAWLPMPSGGAETQSFTNQLTGSYEDGSITFTKKHGTVLSFLNVGGSVELARERVEGSENSDIYHYARVDTVTDRLGYVLQYEYPAGSTGLVPKRIYALTPNQAAIPGLQIYLLQNSGGQVTSAWDPNGNAIAYSYETFNVPDSLADPSSLTEVNFPDGSTSAYAYDYAFERDLTPRNDEDTDSNGTPLSPPYEDPDDSACDLDVQHIDFHHINLASITDGNEHTYGFGYEFDHTREYYVQNIVANDYYPQNGSPRMISKVVLPTGDDVKFVTQNNQEGSRIRATNEGEITGTRVNRVTDAEGFTTTYTFGGMDLEILTQFRDILVENGELLESEAYKNPRILYYTTMTIQHGRYGTESFVFRKDAGLALQSATDLSGNTTSYTYTDDIEIPSGLAEVWPGSIYGHYGDPNTESRPEGASSSFTYNQVYRLMTSVVDPRDKLTEYILGEQGQVTDVNVYDGPTDGDTLVQHTSYLYDGTFTGFVTKETKHNVGADPSWALMVTDYTRDVRGRVTTTTVNDAQSPSGTGTVDLVTETLYDFNGNLVWQEDPLDHYTLFEYDERNRLVQTTFHDDTTKYNVYDPRGNRVGTKDENGHYSVYKYDSLNRLTDEIRVMGSTSLNVGNYNSFKGYSPSASDLHTQHTYNAVNARTSTTENNGSETRVTEFKYDDLQRLRVSANSASANGGLAQDVVTQYVYGINSGGSVFDTETFKPSAVVDPRGYVTQYTYDDLYRPTRVSIRYGKSGGVSTTVNEYDKNGNLTSTTDPLGKETQTTYDALNRPIRVDFADETFVTTIYSSTGFPYAVVDEEGNTTTTEYDKAGRPIKVTQPQVAVYGVGNAYPITETHYDLAGNVKSTINPNDEEWSFAYDDRNRRTDEWQPLVYDYDAAGDDFPYIATAYDNVGNVLSVTDPRGKVTYTGYDRANRPIVTITPQVGVYDSGSTSQAYIGYGTVYDRLGNVVETYTAKLTSLPDVSTASGALSALDAIDEGRRTAENTYDALGRLLATTDAEDITVEYAYDASGNRTQVTDGKNQATTFEYDGLGRNTSTTYSGTDTTTLIYNAVNQTARIDANGQRTEYKYDDRHRLKEVLYTGAGEQNRTYSYDDVGNITAVDEPGTLKDVTYVYDALYRVTEETSAGVEHHYAYDLAGNHRQAVYDDGGSNERTLVSTYDALNRLDTVTEGMRVTGYEYDLSGNIRNKTLANGQEIETEYDALGRKVTITGPEISSNPIYVNTLAYDLYGNLAELDETYPEGNLTARTVGNEYDGANRLTKETVTTGSDTVITSYTYDDANNRTARLLDSNGDTDYLDAGDVITRYHSNSLNQLGYSYEDDNNNSTWDSGSEARIDYTYDANGNRTLRHDGSVETRYYYDRENRLTTLNTATEHLINIHKGSDASGDLLATAVYFTSLTDRYTYAYDYRTRRVLRDESGAGGDKTYVVFSGGTSVQEYTEDGTADGLDSSDTLDVEYIRGSDYGGGVGGILYSLRTGGPSYYHYNGRGDVTAKTATDGSLTYQAAYEAFGKHDSSAPGAQEYIATGAVLDRQRANTKDEDPTGLLNEGFRYRDLETGAFLTRDPLGFVDGPNLYAYVVQNPWTMFDPLGLNHEQAEQVRGFNEVFNQITSGFGLYDTSFGRFASKVNGYFPVGAGIKKMRSAIDQNLSLTANRLDTGSDSIAGSFVKGRIDQLMMNAPVGGNLNTAIQGEIIDNNGDVQSVGTVDRVITGFHAVAEATLIAFSVNKTTSTTAPRTAPEGIVTLEHGTTMARARSMEKGGPNPAFVEPGGSHTAPAGGLSTAKPEGPFPLGSPATYAIEKSKLFPSEGAPAILRMDVPKSIADQAIRTSGEYRFESGFGLGPLMQNWNKISKKVREVKPSEVESGQ